MTTATARPTTVKAIKEPTRYQRAKMLEAIPSDTFTLPRDTKGVSLDLMLEEGWIQEYAANGRTIEYARLTGYQGFSHFRLTWAGRMALLTKPQRLALETVGERGRISAAVARSTVAALEAAGLAAYFTARGERAQGDGAPYITALGRRLMGLDAVDDSPASDSLIAAFAEWGLPAIVERDSDGNTQVVVETGTIRATFSRPVPGMGYSATHPRWMHNEAWYGFVNDGGSYGETDIPEGIGLDAENVWAVESLVEYITAPTRDSN
ncbi:hypothetical protein AB0O47_32525 [Streptomyces noursei]|uniref:hypothetical protein n=1 Tax=Streptomyces noursei TaxID=1971 RepID=UPI00344DF1B4